MNTDAKPYFVRLPGRALIRVAGDDRVPFLQGLVTNDVERVAADGIVYSCLLTAQGKFLHDFFMIDDGEAILIETEGGARAQDLHRRLSLYRLRAKVTLSAPEDAPVFAVSAGGLPDPRHPALLRRAYTAPAGEERAFSLWDEARIRLCVPDGSRDMAVERDTPLDCNLERFNAVSFGKGCYVGQEITARMNYRGLIKKRLHAVDWGATPPPAPFTDIHVDGALAGQARSSCGSVGLAQLKDDALAATQNAPFRVLD